jgi:hypothetical protein
MKGVLLTAYLCFSMVFASGDLERKYFQCKGSSRRSEATFKVPIFAFDDLHKTDDDEEGMKDQQGLRLKDRP